MSEILGVFVASGVTSSLFASFLPMLKTIFHKSCRIVGCVRSTTTQTDEKLKYQTQLKYQNVNLISDEGNLKLTVEHFFKNHNYNDVTRWVILWLSTHDDAETLQTCARFAPVLAIGSGAMLDFYIGKIDLTKIDPGTLGYIQSKIRMALTPGITTLLPGFYIEDDENVPKTPGGLHRDTTCTLVDPIFNPKSDIKWWGKGKYVTPKTLLSKYMIHWMFRPNEYLNRWYHVGSSREWQRWELRQAALDDVPIEIQTANPLKNDNIYEKWAEQTKNAFFLSKSRKCSDEDVVSACKKMKLWNDAHQ